MSLLKELKGVFVDAADSIGGAINDFARLAYNDPEQAFVKNPVQAVRDFATAVDTISTEAYFFPRQTLVTRPIAAIKSAHQAISETATNKLPSIVPRDKTTGRIIATGAAAYVLDIPDPFPIGESIAIIAFSAAALRGSYVGWRQTRQSNQNNTPAAHYPVLAHDDLQ
jgi:hypothetical protein